jgi:hypothetical protein
MQIFIQHNGQQTGPFPIEAVLAGLRNGLYQPADLAWYEGAAGWLPLSTVPGIGGNSIWSLVLGILSFLTLGLTGIPAVVCGHLARGKIKRSAGSQTGDGLAMAGLVIGYIGTVIVGIAFLAGLAAPLVIRQRKKADQTEAISNLRSLGLALFEFENEYGSYPNDATAPVVAKATDSDLIQGKSANARFRQLIRANFTQSEMLFHARLPGIRKPDNRIDGDHALEPGECAYAYIESSFTGPRPLAIAPLVPGTDRFDPKPFDGKAVILWTDNSVRSLPIDRKSGQVMLDGKPLFDPTNKVWGGRPPVICHPE